MKFYLSEVKINGCKSINKEITLKFSNVTVKPNFDPKRCNVKAIYGPNGAGKSAIITTMLIYQRLINDESGLQDKSFKKFVYDSINKSLNKLSMEFVFVAYNKDNHKTFKVVKHNIVLSARQNENVVIESEEVSYLVGNSIGSGKFNTAFKTQNGEALGTDSLNYKDAVDKATMNLVDKQSIVSLTESILFKVGENVFDDNLTSLVLIKLAALSIVVEIEASDMHTDYISNKLLYESVKNSTKEINFEMMIDDIFVLNSSKSDVVEKKMIDEYKALVKRMETFIKVFKPELKSIDLDIKENGDKYFCDKIMNYGDGVRFNVELESTGIKKLIRIYNALYSASNGKIVFIDEFDANLHDVYFSKLVEFMRDYSTGQICFTTHNLEPIDVLKSNDFSLDFLSDNSMIHSWKKDGNKSPSSMYFNGLIPYSPFNINSFDFADALLDEENL